MLSDPIASGFRPPDGRGAELHPKNVAGRKNMGEDKGVWWFTFFLRGGMRTAWGGGRLGCGGGRRQLRCLGGGGPAKQ